jgi:hypothetical protein
MMRRILLALGLVIAAAGVATAIVLPSIDPCRDQMIMGCPFLPHDRIGLRLVIGGAGLLAGTLVLLVRAVEKRLAALRSWLLGITGMLSSDEGYSCAVRPITLMVDAPITDRQPRS